MATGCSQKNAATYSRIVFALTLACSGSGGTRPMCVIPLKPNALADITAYLSALLSLNLNESLMAYPGPEVIHRIV